MSHKISVRGASEHNLKNVDLDIDHDSLTVITGLSGSGKSSFAFDTVFKEGQRRYVESLSAYARQFLGQMERPKVDHIEGLAPAAAIDQKTVSRNPRSTVGTITEISDYLRLLYARIGNVHCHVCDTAIEPQTSQQIVESIVNLPAENFATIFAPVVRHRKGEHRELMTQLRAAGYVRARIDGELTRFEPLPELSRTHWHDIDIVIDRIRIDTSPIERITDSVESALELANGLMILGTSDGDFLYSANYGCPKCGASTEPPEPSSFSFNSRRGSCGTCKGLGKINDINPKQLVKDPDKSIRNGALALTNKSGYTLYARMPMTSWEQLGQAFGFDIDEPWNSFDEGQKKLVLYGAGSRTYTKTVSWSRDNEQSHGSRTQRRRWQGLIPLLRRRAKKSTKMPSWVQELMSDHVCPDCNGQRLRPESLSVKFNGINLAKLSEMTVTKIKDFLQHCVLTKRESEIAQQVMKEIDTRLSFLEKVGLGYLTLNRSADTLAGGEAQRIRLAAQIGAGLQGVLYVLDEPSIGLHHKDNVGLLNTLQTLRDQGNTLVVVEHDEMTIRQADAVVDFGPGAGDDGGNIVASGSPEQVARSKSPTGKFLQGLDPIVPPSTRRKGNGSHLRILGARTHNLKNVDVTIPLGTLTVVTGVSGSGKSSLVNDVIKKELSYRLHRSHDRAGDHDDIIGIDHLDKIIEIDQSPIGRNPRSNPATYSGVFKHIRDLFQQLPDSRARGYSPGRFSFNVKGGRCEACAGRGSKVVEMQFMGDVEVTCEVCDGQRFNRETLKVLYRGKNISDILNLRIRDALQFFENIPAAQRILQTMVDVGLDYLALGQSSTTLSGGEAQRLKLSSELARPQTGSTIYILDEPTTGLHFEDVKRLVRVLQRLVESGNTVVVVEHNPDIIKMADWIIDLGPDGGDKGGQVVAEGPPEHIATIKKSHTGNMLADVLQGKNLISSRKTRKRRKSRKKNTSLIITNATKHNLKGVDISIPKNEITVITGVSGSGKSSLAMDTIFAEGQRRFVECLSSYARQFLGRLEDADVGDISGLAPAISITQENATRTPRSLVVTSTEIYDYLRVLYARAGKPHCPNGHGPITGTTSSEISAKLASLPDGDKIQLLAPVKPENEQPSIDLLKQLLSEGFIRVRVGAETINLSEGLPDLPSDTTTDISVVIDRITCGPTQADRIGDSVEMALSRGAGRLIAEQYDTRNKLTAEHKMNTQPLCAECGEGLNIPLTPRHFSFNSYLGACPDCDGLGSHSIIDPNLVVPDDSLSYAAGAIAFLESDPIDSWWGRWAIALSDHYGIDLYAPWRELSSNFKQILLHGSEGELVKRSYIKNDDRGETRSVRKEEWEGFIPIFERWFERTGNPGRQQSIGRFMRDDVCSACKGERLQPILRSVQFSGYTLPNLLKMTISNALEHFRALKRGSSKRALSANEREIAKPAIDEIVNRLSFLEDVGVGYLTLDRATATLSGGEAQRIRLATQVGTRLVGALYVLDEPSIGLHQRDIDRLLKSLDRLRNLGNTVIVIEHDEKTIRHANHIIDIGPGAGEQGGQIIISGSLSDVMKCKESPTGRMLRGQITGNRVKMIPRIQEADLTIVGARENNLKDLTVSIPVGAFTAVSGVSGSGKSTLIDNILRKSLRRTLHGALDIPGEHDAIDGTNHVDKIVVVNQSPIGRTARSTPATYTGTFSEIRTLYSRLPESRILGFGVRRFSFNEGPGKCTVCRGEGQQRISMQFLADVEIQCEVCEGKRYNSQTLRVKYRGKNIADVLGMTVDEALEHFTNVPRVKRSLQVLSDVGLGYIRLGQSARTLSGGEAQRIKLAAELARVATGNTLYILDEPTVGLHASDVEKLLEVLNRLVDAGNTVVAIEHDLTVIGQADHVIDLGLEGGNKGGNLVVAGTPGKVSNHETSYTGHYLKLMANQITSKD